LIALIIVLRHGRSLRWRILGETMLPSFVLALREGLEICLITGILFGALHHFERQDLFPIVRLGIVGAVVVSLAVAVLLALMGSSLEGESEAIFEGVMMWTAASVLTWMILWMRSRASRIKSMIRNEVGVATRTGKLALFFVAFVAVLREGIELAIFLTASVFASSTYQTIGGAMLGIGSATLIGWGLYRATIKVNMQRFFQMTSILLVLFAAGLIAHGTHEFNEVGLIPALVAPVWDLNPLLSENSVVGQILKVLFGYNGDPSLTEAISYLFYFVLLYLATKLKLARPQVRMPIKSV
jgi:high-affinity iron transporter